MDLLTEKASKKKKECPLHSIGISLGKISYVIPSVIIYKYFKKYILQNYKIIK
jgi:hypothetical protein